MTIEWKVVSLPSNNSSATKLMNQYESDGWNIYQITDSKLVVYRVHEDPLDIPQFPKD